MGNNARHSRGELLANSPVRFCNSLLTEEIQVFVKIVNYEVITEMKKPTTKVPNSSKFAMFLSEEEKRGNLTKASQKQILLKPPAKLKSKIKKEDWWKIYEQVRADRFL